MAAPADRYQELGYREALERTNLYPSACKELSLILDHAYRKLPKTVQLGIFEDILSAFRFLPVMRSSNAVSAAHRLFQSVEGSLPKQKRNIAGKEFKHAMIAQKRSIKAQKEPECGSTDFPEDILIQIFGRLDVQSLVSSAHVCRSWNSTANNNFLWKSLYYKVFSAFPLSCSVPEIPKIDRTREDMDAKSWKKLFKDVYERESSKLLTSNRGFCPTCHRVVWLDYMVCSSRECIEQPHAMNITYMPPHEVPDYLLYGFSTFRGSDSDEESFVQFFIDYHSL